jgi:hypothetical protein
MNVFAGKRTEESVAYDLALALAVKDPSANTPQALIERIADLLPACRSSKGKVQSRSTYAFWDRYKTITDARAVSSAAFIKFCRYLRSSDAPLTAFQQQHKLRQLLKLRHCCF